MTVFMAEMIMGAPQQPQGLAGVAAQAASADAAYAEGAAAGDSAAQGSE